MRFGKLWLRWLLCAFGRVKRAGKLTVLVSAHAVERLVLVQGLNKGNRSSEKYIHPDIRSKFGLKSACCDDWQCLHFGSVVKSSGV